MFLDICSSLKKSMKKQLLNGALIASALTTASFLGATPAEALSFDFGGPLRTVNQIDFVSGGINLKATGSIANGASRKVFQSNAGLGVSNSVINLDGNQIDGLGLDETLNLLFSEKVNLVSATFKAVSANDSFKLLVDGSEFMSADIPGGGFFESFQPALFSFSPSPQGSLFGFSVTDFNDDYLLSAIEVTPIPTPVALPGLLAMGWAAIRKKKQEDDTSESC